MNLKSVIGFEAYRVSDVGVIINRRGKILKPAYDRHGYLFVALHKNGKQKLERIHTLILNAFVELRPIGKECNHINGTRDDNRLENLEWVTRVGNIKNAIERGTYNKRGGNNAMAKLKDNEVWLIRKILSYGVIKQLFIAKIFKVSEATISMIKNNNIWTNLSNPILKDYKPTTRASRSAGS